MKKLLLSLSFLLSAVVIFGQYPNPYTKIGSPGTMVFAAGGLKSDSTFIPPVYLDTTAANTTKSKLYVGSTIYSSLDNGYYVRDNVKWNRINSYCGGLLYGGIVTYSGTGLVFNVSPGQFCLNGKPYNFSQGTVTLATADPSLPRQDVIFADTLGNVGAITGTPNANPAVPQVNGTSQIYLTSILVPSGSSTPGGITSTVVYDENTEWTTSSTGGITANFNNTVSPYHLIKAIDGVNNSSSATLHFNNPGGILQSANYTTLSLFINNQEVSLAPKLQVALTLAGNPVTQAIQIGSQYGYNYLTAGGYQNVAIPFSDFLYYGTHAFDGMTFYLNEMPDFYMDYIRIQSGVPGPVVSSLTLQGAFNNDSTRMPQIDSRENGLAINARTGADAAHFTISGSIISMAVSDTTSGYASEVSSAPFVAELIATDPQISRHSIDVYYGRIEISSDTLGATAHPHVLINHIDTTSTTDYIAGFKNGTDELIKIPFSGGSGGGSGSLQDAYDTSIARGDVPYQITGDLGVDGDIKSTDTVITNHVKITGNSPASGKVLTSDADGNGVWRNPATSGTVISVATGYGLSGGIITTSGTLLVDSATLSNYYLRKKDSTNAITGYTTKYQLGLTNANVTTNTTNIATNTTAIATKISNITGLITAGANVTVSGSGTSGSPYSIAASGGGGGGGLDSLRKAANSDSIKQYSGGTGTFAVRVQRLFNVRDYGADNTNATDATAAIQLAINACDSAGGGTVYFPNGTYKISGSLQTSVSGTNPNCQIYVPAHTIAGTLRTQIIFLGESSNNLQSGFSTLIVPQQTTGVTLISTISGSGTNPSIIGTKGIGGDYQDYNYSRIVIENINLRAYTNHGASAPSLTGINMFYAADINIENVSVALDTINQASATPASTETAGIIFSGINNDGGNEIKNTYVSGYKYGYLLGEHTILSNAYSISNYYGFVIPKLYYTISGKALVHACPYGFLFPTYSVMGLTTVGACYLNLDVESEIDSSGVTKWYKSLKNVLDTSNYAYGVMRFMNVDGAGSGTNLNSSISVYNGSNIVVQDYEGKYRRGITIVDGTQGANKYLVSDANGKSSWAAPQWTTSTNDIYNANSANIGLGNAAPAYDVDLTKTKSAFTTFNIKNASTNSAAGAAINMQNSAGIAQLFKASTGYGGYKTLNANDLGIYNATDISLLSDGGKIDFAANGHSTADVTIQTTGLVTMSAYGAGTATFDASGNITSISDERMKIIQGHYSSGLKELMNLKPIYYKWNKKSGNETKGIYAGFSAQNVKANIPYGTGINKDGYLSLQDRALLATLVNSVQEQQKEIEGLKQEIRKLRGRK